MRSQGLDKFYDLRDGTRLKQPVLGSLIPNRAVEAFDARLASKAEPLSVVLTLSGLQCAACDWVVRQTFFAAPGARGLVTLDDASFEIHVESPFSLRDYAQNIAHLGYQLDVVEAGQGPKGASAGLALRLAATCALAANVMLLSASRYFGLVPEALDLGSRTFDLAALVDRIGIIFATLAVAIVWPVLARPAWRAWVMRRWHFDQPLALGLGLAYLGTLLAYARNDAGAFYPDTVAVFAALILLGRVVQQQVRRRAAGGAPPGTPLARTWVRLSGDGQAHYALAESLQQGVAFEVAPGEVVLVRAQLLAGKGPQEALFSTEWMTGESAPTRIAAGMAVPAGAVLRSDTSVTLEALEGLKASHLSKLLATRTQDITAEALAAGEKARAYCLTILTAAGLTLVGQSWAAGLATALRCTTAVLVVACPCALVIALPLLRRLIAHSVERLGVWAVLPQAIETLGDVRSVAFDKTGTLTRLTHAADLTTLPSEARRALLLCAQASAHPQAKALLDLLETESMESTATGNLAGNFADAESMSAVRHTPLGVEVRSSTARYRLGRRDFACDQATDQRLGVVFSRDSEVLLDLRAEETLSDTARRSLEALGATGRKIVLISGDTADKVAEVNAHFAFASVHSAVTPEGKAAVIKRLPGPVLFVGDGVNDLPAARAAAVAIAMHSDRPLLASEAGILWFAPDLSRLPALLVLGSRVQRDVARLIRLSFGYNLLAIVLAAFGHIPPWMAALVMPASSIGLVATALGFHRFREREIEAVARDAADLAASPRGLERAAAR